MSETLFKINEWLDYLFAYGPFWVYLAIFLACFDGLLRLREEGAVSAHV